MKKLATNKNNKNTLIYTILITITILIILCSSQTSFAAPIPVDNSTSGGGIAQGLATSTSGDTLVLAIGNYTGTNNTGLLINHSVKIQGDGPTDQVIIDAEGQRFIFETNNPNINIEFINITFINGNNVGGNGGAICNLYANTMMTFINCTFINNTGNQGGAIWNNGSYMYVEYSNFTNNTVYGDGGAIWNNGTGMHVEYSNFTNNTAYGDGGAIYNLGDQLNVFYSSFIDNTAYFTNNTTYYGTYYGNGGAIWNNGYGMYVEGSDFISNTAYVGGGAIYNLGDQLIVFYSSFISNTAYYYVVLINNVTYYHYGDGGAIWNNGYDMYVWDSDFISNTVYGDGGAIWNNGYYMYVWGSDFFSNTAYGDGGAIYNSFNGFGVSITHSTFGFNSANYGGGGIYNEGNMFVSANTMFGNYASFGREILNHGNIGDLFLTFINNATENVFVGEIVHLFATLTDDRGNPVSGGVIYFTIDGVIIDHVFVYEGYAYTDYIVPSLVTSFSVNGDYLHYWGYLIDILGGTLLKVQTNVNSTISVLSVVKVGQTVNISGVVTNQFGNPLDGFTFEITIDGVPHVLTTNANGSWSLLNVTSYVGNILLIVSFAGDVDYYNFINSTFFNVEKTTTSSTFVVPNGTVNQTINITGTLTDEFNNTMASVSFNVIVGGNTHSVTTDSSGQWILPYTSSNVGNINVIIDWAGDSIYVGFTNSKAFTVTPRNLNNPGGGTGNLGGGTGNPSNGTGNSGNKTNDSRNVTDNNATSNEVPTIYNPFTSDYANTLLKSNDTVENGSGSELPPSKPTPKHLDPFTIFNDVKPIIATILSVMMVTIFVPNLAEGVLLSVGQSNNVRPSQTDDSSSHLVAVQVISDGFWQYTLTPYKDGKIVNDISKQGFKHDLQEYAKDWDSVKLNARISDAKKLEINVSKDAIVIGSDKSNSINREINLDIKLK